MVTAHSAILLRGGSFGSVSPGCSAGCEASLGSLICSAILDIFAVNSIVSFVSLSCLCDARRLTPVGSNTKR